MKSILLVIISFLTISMSFADTQVCSFKSNEGESYKVAFKFNEGAERDQVLVTIYRNNRIQISHLTKTKSDSDSHGDGWSMTLRDSKHPQYRYEVFFDAQYVTSLYLTMPGLKEFYIDSCRKIRN